MLSANFARVRIRLYGDRHARARHGGKRRDLRVCRCRADQAASVPESSRLVGVFERVEAFPQSNLSYADYLDWKKLNTVFSSLAAYQGSGVTLATTDGVERAPAARVSDDFFRTLGVDAGSRS